MTTTFGPAARAGAGANAVLATTSRLKAIRTKRLRTDNTVSAKGHAWDLRRPYDRLVGRPMARWSARSPRRWGHAQARNPSSALAEVEHDEEALGGLDVEGGAHEGGLGEAVGVVLDRLHGPDEQAPRVAARRLAKGQAGTDDRVADRHGVGHRDAGHHELPAGLPVDLPQGPALLVETDDDRASVDDVADPRGVASHPDDGASEGTCAFGIRHDRQPFPGAVGGPGVDADLPREVRWVTTDDADGQEIHIERLGDAQELTQLVV